jgi:3-oxoadipate enol-lactonase
LAKATIGGIEIAYTDTGAGTPVVFIHGFPLSKAMWEPNIAELSRTARCVAVDLRGHGESDAPFWLTSVDVYADEVVGLMDHLGIERATVCGFSMGGYVTFALLRRHADRVGGLVLADTRPQPDNADGKQGRFNMALKAQKEGPASIAGAMLPRLLSESSVATKPELVAKVRSMIESTPVQGMAGDLMAMAERPDSRDLLGGIAVPALVVVGEQDVLTPPADAKAMAEAIPGARLVVIPGCGHLANMEDPAAFNRAVRALLA